MKKALILVLILLVLCLVACKSEDKPQESTHPPVGDPQEITTNQDPLPEDDAKSQDPSPQVENQDQVSEDTPLSDMPAPVLKSQLDQVSLAVKEVVPNYQWTTLTGDTVNLADFRGQVVLINFWTTWCGYCVEEMPDLDKLNDREDVVVLGINSQEDKSKVEAFIEKGAYDFPIILDPDGSYTKHFFVSGFPTTYFLDEDGILLGMSHVLSLEEAEVIIKNIQDDVYN